MTVGTGNDINVCRFCAARLDHVFADLGVSPFANSYIPPERVNRMEPFYPLRALVCGRCFLVQVEEFETPHEIFSDYAYFSSYSTTWLDHSRTYVEGVVERFGLDESSHVVEVASNDGYLLQYFHERRIPVLGIEPAANVAKVALQKGIPTLVAFFGRNAARSLTPESQADLLVANNVLAHVPDINDFVGGLKILLKPGGVITIEFQHLEQLVAQRQWDTIYHEHFSYLSLVTAQRVFEAHGLRLFDVDELPTHGGSLRVYCCHDDDNSKRNSEAVEIIANRERSAGFEALGFYTDFNQQAQRDKREIVRFLIDLKESGKQIVGYGAPAKGNTLLNFCGIGRDFLDYTCDLNPRKQGHYLPGSRVPIRSPDAILEDRPDIVLILPWNLKDEVISQLIHIREWGGMFAVRAPELKLL